MTEPSPELVEEIARTIYESAPLVDGGSLEEGLCGPPISWERACEWNDESVIEARKIARAVLSSASIAKMRTDAYVEGENAARAFLLGSS